MQANIQIVMNNEDTIASLYLQVKNEVTNIQGKLTFEKFQKIHKDFIKLSSLIDKADLFSNNENFKEIPFDNIKYLIINFDHGKFLDKYAVSSQLSNDSDPLKRNKLRILVLEIVESMIWKFIKLVVIDLKIFDYLKIINDSSVYNELNNWIMNYYELRQNEISNNGSKGFVKLNELEQINFKKSTPMERRDMKINKWKLEKELKERIKILDENDIKNGENNDDLDNFNKFDDDVMRRVRIDQIVVAITESISMLENFAMEREMLTHVVGNAIDEELKELRLGDLRLKEIREEENDSRTKGKFDKGFTDKVEYLNKDNKNNIISKEGKVLQPFTIVPSNEKRKELQGKVFGTGQELPTMTVEELVDYELANGGMVKPSEPEPEIDEDDYKWQDSETYRLRDWDNFTDENRKGSGNKMSNLG